MCILGLWLPTLPCIHTRALHPQAAHENGRINDLGRPVVLSSEADNARNLVHVFRSLLHKFSSSGGCTTICAYMNKLRLYMSLYAFNRPSLTSLRCSTSMGILTSCASSTQVCFCTCAAIAIGKLMMIGVTRVQASSFCKGNEQFKRCQQGAKCQGRKQLQSGEVGRMRTSFSPLCHSFARPPI